MAGGLSLLESNKVFSLLYLRMLFLTALSKETIKLCKGDVVLFVDMLCKLIFLCLK